MRTQLPRRRFCSITALLLLVALGLTLPLLCWGQDAQQAEKDLAFAQGLYRQQNYQLAADKFVEFVNKYPNHANMSLAAFRAGECLFRLGRYQEAIGYLEQVVQRFPDSAEAESAWCWLGDACFKAEQYQKAVDAYEALLEKFPNTQQAGRAAYWLGESYHHLGQHEKAIEAYRTSLAKSPEGDEAPYAAYALGWTYLQIGQPQEAVQHLQHVLTKHAQSSVAAECQYLLGVARQDLGDYEAAIGEFQKVIAAYGNTPFAPRAQLGIGWCHFHRKDYNKARDAFGQVRTKHPNSPEVAEAQLRLADCDFFLERWEQAAEGYARIAEDTNGRFAPEALYWLAVTRERQGQAEQALATHNQLLTQFPQSPRVADSYLHIGQLQAAAGNTEAAVSAFESAAARATTDEQKQRAQKALAWARYQKDKTGGSLEELDKLVRRDPTTAEALDLGIQVAGAHFEAGRYQAALELVELLLKGHPQDPRVWTLTYLAGACQDKLGNDAEAEKLLKSVLEQGGKSEHAGPAAATLVGIYARQGKLDKARQMAAELAKSGADKETVAFSLYSIAEALLKAGSPADASVLYSQALAADPDGPVAAFCQAGLGWAKAAAAEADAADAFRTLARNYPDSEAAAQAPDGLLSIAEKLYAQEKYAEAQALYEEILAGFADSEAAPKARYKLAWALMKQGKPNEALGHFEQVAQSTADAAIVADARYQAARLLADKGDWAKASELLAPLGQAAEPAEKVGWALALLGSCQAHLGKQTEALATFESLLTRFPEHPARADALVGMARVYRELKQPDKALEAAQKALQIAGERGAEAHFELASCYRDQGKTEEAAEEFLKVAILYGNRHWGARAQYEAGQCYEQLDRPQVAISTYEVIVRDFSDQEAVVKQAQARIDALKAG